MLPQRFISVTVIGLFLTMTAVSQMRDSNTVEARRKELKQLLADEWEYELRESPETATIIGDYRYNDRWSDFSLAHITQQKHDIEKWLSRFAAVDTTGFPEQEKLNQSLMVRNLKENLEGIALHTYEMPMNQFSGAHLQLAQFIAYLPLDSTKHYEDYLARLRRVPRLVDDVIEILRQGAKDKLMPPRFLLEKTVSQCKSIAAPEGEANVFGQPASNIPRSMPDADRKRLYDAIVAAVNKEVRPAYSHLANFIATDYAPKGRTDPGLWALPDGDARYRFAVRQSTTLEMDPEAIHQLGLKEVAGIEGRQLAIAKTLGFADLKSFRDSLKANPKIHPKSREQILEAYKHYIAQMEPQLPKLFGLLPKTRVEVRPVQEYREKEAAGAEYSQGTPDGSRPGVVYVNTGDFEHRTTLTFESTAYHEGVPGHHMQIAVAQTLPELPPFRQQAGYTAYVEGWALYAERLGKEIGFYQDPYSDYGRLSDEMLRAVRLVVDTGVHYKHWTRQQMVDFFHEHSSEDEPSVQAETDRYIVIPGQALAYKLGQLEILKLRERAKNELGNRYDIRAFHDEILNGGALPMDVLESRVGAWVSAQKLELKDKRDKTDKTSHGVN
ncbi:MAG TPA: DUF885 family protein [Candidatus Dormibacteraeota bacterium]|nr:DUF885 family protein [Candidatus Dormibacteraeota bacterium]